MTYKYYYIGYDIDNTYDVENIRIMEFDGEKCTIGKKINTIEANHILNIEAMINKFDKYTKNWIKIKCNQLKIIEKNKKLLYFVVSPHIINSPIKIHHYIPNGLYENKIDLYNKIAYSKNMKLNDIKYIPESFPLNESITLDNLFKNIKQVIDGKPIAFWRKNNYWLLKDSDSSLGNRIHGFMIHMVDNKIDFGTIKNNLKSDIMAIIINDLIDDEYYKLKHKNEYCNAYINNSINAQIIFYAKYYKKEVNKYSVYSLSETLRFIESLIDDYVHINPNVNKTARWYINKYIVPFKIPSIEKISAGYPIKINKTITIDNSFWKKIQNRWIHIRCYLCPIITYYEDKKNPYDRYRKNISGYLYPKYSIYLSNKEKSKNIDECIYNRNEIISQNFDEYEIKLYQELILKNNKLSKFTYDDLFEIIIFIFNKTMTNGSEYIWNQIKLICKDLLHVKMGLECFNNPNLDPDTYSEKIKLEANKKFTCFKILGIDFIIDNNLSVNLLEYNTGPFVKDVTYKYYYDLIQLLLYENENMNRHIINIYDGPDSIIENENKTEIHKLGKIKKNDNKIDYNELIKKELKNRTINPDIYISLTKLNEKYKEAAEKIKEKYLLLKYMIIKKYI